MTPPLDLAPQSTPATTGSSDPIVRLLERLERLSETVAPSQRGMSEDINKLLLAAREPGATRSPEFRTQVAYLLQDIPKFSGYGLQVVVKEPLGQELAQLALTFPGLENLAVQSLVRAASYLTDRALIADIRHAAAAVAQEGTGRQNSHLAEDEVRRLQPRVDASGARRVAGLAASAAPVAAPAAAQDAAVEPPARLPGTAIPPIAAGGTSRPAASATKPDYERSSRPSPATDPELSAADQGMVPPATRPGSEATASSGTRTTLGDRFDALGARLNQQKNGDLIRVAEAAGTEAVEALGAFHKGPGKEFMARLDEAARQDPGGMEAVLAGMTPGGQYSGLRREFEERLKTDRPFVQAYNDVERTVEKYGRKRVQTNEDALKRNLDVNAIDARFQQSDAEVARHLQGIPGRELGQNMLQELAQQAMHVLTRAFQAVQDLLARNPKPDRRPSQGPSPS